MIAVSTTFVNIMLLLHILSALVAFGPLFVYPPLARSGNTKGLAAAYQRIVLPALLLTMVFGMGAQGTQSEIYSMSQTWLIVSFLVWLAVAAVGLLLVRPALLSEDASTKSKLSMGIGITHVGMLIILIMMIWKPGFGG